MYNIAILGTASSGMDVSGLTSALTLSAFQSVIEALLPIVAVAVLVGFLFFSLLRGSLGYWFIPRNLTLRGSAPFPCNRKRAYDIKITGDFFV